MNRISAFISYSSQEKIVGGKLKKSLEKYCGYETFIAHDDIPGATIWEPAILKAISKSDIFIPIISESFKNSPYCDQETGIAFYLRKKTVPIKLDNTDPYGFISKFQALKYKQNSSDNKDNLKEIVLTISNVVLELNPKKIYRQKALNSTIHAFRMSRSTNTANALIKAILTCNDLNTVHLKQICGAVRENVRINNTYYLPDLKQFLNNKYKIKID